MPPKLLRRHSVYSWNDKQKVQDFCKDDDKLHIPTHSACAENSCRAAVES